MSVAHLLLLLMITNEERINGAGGIFKHCSENAQNMIFDLSEHAEGLFQHTRVENTFTCVKQTKPGGNYTEFSSPVSSGWGRRHGIK